ncbi:MAG: thiol reductant ABC exporter subunit CydC, partial [Bombella apis]|nr:thiol reductant ABC exporter subunit CydC [Bombella apis]
MRQLQPLWNVWKARGGRLLIGLVLAELSVCAAFLLMGQTGSRLGLIAIGGVVAFGILRFAGAAR